MNLRYKLFLLIAFFPALISHAQVVHGRVIDVERRESVVSAVVMEEGTGNGTVTDYDGEFSFKVSKVPTVLLIRYVGFKEQTVSIQNIDQKLLIEMEPSDMGPTIEFRDTRISEKQKQNPLTVERMDLTAIKNTPAGTFYEGLGALKGVDLTTASLGFRVINTRGFNSTSPVRSLQLIDGVDNQSPGLNFSLGNFLGAPDLDVVAVEIVQGASSAFYGPGAFNGVIKMETKSPFQYTGLNAQLRIGERELVEPAVRFAHAFKNKEGFPFLAYKFNVYAFKALDWSANNQNPIYNSGYSSSNPGRYDAVNTYGDEYFSANNFSTAPPWNYPGLGTFFRTGYKESDLVDYHTKNVKANAALHWRLSPELEENSPEFIVAGNIGQGTTVYQGDNRFSLRNILFYQGRMELRKKEKYFIRVYGTGENAGDSFDPYFTALKLQEEARSNEDWSKVYVKYWNQLIKPRAIAMGYPQLTLNPNWPGPAQDPTYSQFYLPYDYNALNQWNTTYQDSLVAWHSWVANLTNNGNANIVNISTDGYYDPGSDKFVDAFQRITQAKNNATEKGTRFFDKSALFHASGEYQWTDKFFIDYRVGGNARLYRPYSSGTIFQDSISRITNYEAGMYFGMSKKFFENKLIASGTVRVDKNVNFNALLSPAASLVYQPIKNQYFRVSFSSALRNPTLTDQYLHLNVGPAILSGNLHGVDSLITLQSFMSYRSTLKTDSLVYFNIDPIRPEQVRTLEFGYRGGLFDSKVYIDLGAYYSMYKHFIGYNIGIDAKFDPTTNLPMDLQVYRYSANSKSTVTTEGLTVGVNYYFHEKHSLNANYSYNVIAKSDANDPIIPAFNTPRNKYNIGLTGSKLFETENKSSFGYSINYKWVQGFLFEGSPQFTGNINTYDMVDVQINYVHTPSNFFVKLGASNVLNNQQVQVYGGPKIGRMAYLSLAYSFNHQKQKQKP